MSLTAPPVAVYERPSYSTVSPVYTVPTSVRVNCSDQCGDRQISLRAGEEHLTGGDAFDASTASDRMCILILAPFLDGL